MDVNASAPRPATPASLDSNNSSTSPQSSESTATPRASTIISRRAIILDATQPPYDEDPIDLTIGAQLSDDHTYEDLQYSDSPADIQLTKRLEEMKKVRSTLPVSVMLELVRIIYPPSIPHPKGRPFIRVGLEDPWEWKMVHDTILQARNKWFPDVELPLRYYRYAQDEDF